MNIKTAITLKRLKTTRKTRPIRFWKKPVVCLAVAISTTVPSTRPMWFSTAAMCATVYSVVVRLQPSDVVT